MLLQHIRSSFQKYLSCGGFDSAIVSQMQITKAVKGHITCSVVLQKENMNFLGSAHGGWVAGVVDIAGSLSVASMGLDRTGVSTDINISYLAGAKEGDTLTIDAYCRKLGRTLAFTEVEIRSSEALMAIGRHTKYVPEKIREQKIPLDELPTDETSS
ncbi:hypothetical protein H4R33_003460 [Dimargaris cristalligena]|uniref:HotDog domain-containing protein n=1 Tax=Dimargaris cristalligena TaxID=215637 RepID=A0A4P9ZZJ9_9FUNG|nr:hypothetical protein H4R33_003460 [Dimargaris cristalligena]RKP38541.1 HotDog domain-containing protein [Dimargaris cristalligena]|eukprot:RKP38541.1 HotDog domain-containing protein [Dimargaris cristalligena]